MSGILTKSSQIQWQMFYGRTISLVILRERLFDVSWTLQETYLVIFERNLNLSVSMPRF